ncbi:MAG: alpha/beta hydrolase [Acidobacteriia bacterium]|nr:alpha/beta hydrolase [Terriglobia bacterium]
MIFLRQESFVFFPERAIAGTPVDVGLRYEPVRLQTADGLALGAWWIPAERPRGALVFAHGNGGNISHRIDKLALLHGLGLSVLAFDYRGYGESQGRPSEQGTYRDMDAAVGFVTGDKGVPPARVLYLGESLGGAVAVEAASRRPPAGLVLESSFTSVHAMARRYYPWLPARLLVTIRYDSLSRMRDVACPTLIIHSPDDDIVPYAMGRELFAAARQPKAFADLSGGHNSGGIAVSPEAQEALAAFVGAVLGPGS